MKQVIYNGKTYEHVKVNVSGTKIWLWRDMKNNYYADNYIKDLTKRKIIKNKNQMSIYELIK